MAVINLESGTLSRIHSFSYTGHFMYRILMDAVDMLNSDSTATGMIDDNANQPTHNLN